jgi:hypothetical protein
VKTNRQILIKWPRQNFKPQLPKPPKRTKKPAGVFLDTLNALAYKESKKNGEFVLNRFWQAGEAEEKGAHGL